MREVFLSIYIRFYSPGKTVCGTCWRRFPQNDWAQINLVIKQLFDKAAE
jgi:hypothetical protein